MYVLPIGPRYLLSAMVVSTRNPDTTKAVECWSLLLTSQLVLCAVEDASTACVSTAAHGGVGAVHVGYFHSRLHDTDTTVCS